MKKPTARRAVKSLADCLPGEIAELADVTPYGGSVHALQMDAGTRVSVSWHQPSKDSVTTFVRMWYAPAGWSDPVPVAATARVAKVLVSKGLERSKPIDDVDPLQKRLSAKEPLWSSSNSESDQ